MNMQQVGLNRLPDPRQLAGPVEYPLAAPPYPLAMRQANAVQWRRIVHSIQKRWRTALVFIVVFLAMLVLVLLFMKDTYEATARIEIAPPATPEALSLRDQAVQVSATGQDYFQTQLEILKSDALALSVIQNLHLDQNPELAGKPLIPFIPMVKRWMGVHPSPAGMEDYVKAFKKNLNVSQVRNSELVDISFASQNPDLSTKVTNNLVDTYLERARRSQYEATMAAAGALSNELNDLKSAVDKANQALIDFQQKNGIVDVGGAPAGQNGGSTAGPQNPITERIVELNRQLTQAEADRLNNQAFVRMVNSGDAGSLPQMRDNVVLQELQKRLAESRADLAQALAVYGENNSNVRRLRNQTNELQTQSDLERQRIINQVKTAYNSSQAHEQLLRSTLDEMKGSLDHANQSMVEYDLLKQEAESKSGLYVSLTSKLKEIAISSSLFASNIRILDHAHIPEHPARPQRLAIFAIGFLFSLVTGSALALVRENMDDSISTMDDVKDWTGLPCLGIVPQISGNGFHLNVDARGLFGRSHLGRERRMAAASGPRSRFFIERPGSPEAEAMHSLDTSIRLPVRTDAEPRQVLVIASPFPSEGKTTIAMNLAMALSKHGSTCLVDGDLRNPQVARSFPVSSQKGLREVLLGQAPIDDVLQPVPRLDKLLILPAGSAPADPVELLASASMRDVMARLRSRFKYVVIDSPPVVPYADSRWLSCLADGVVLVARCGTTTKQAIGLSAEILKELRAPVLGVVLNGVDLKSDYYWYGYGYNTYGTKTA
jgi:polysaccharide biosynthesis transport protein